MTTRCATRAGSTASRAPVSARALEILDAVEQAVARSAGEAGEQVGEARADPPAGDVGQRAGAVEDQALSRMVLGVAEHTRQARATLDELSAALDRLARHLAFDR